MENNKKIQIITLVTIGQIFLIYLFSLIALNGTIDFYQIFIYLIVIIISVALIYSSFHLIKDKNEENKNRNIEGIFFILAAVFGFMDFSEISFILLITAMIFSLLTTFSLFKRNKIDLEELKLLSVYTFSVLIFFVSCLLTQSLNLIPLFFAAIALFLKLYFTFNKYFKIKN